MLAPDFVVLLGAATAPDGVMDGEAIMLSALLVLVLVLDVIHVPRGRPIVVILAHALGQDLGKI